MKEVVGSEDEIEEEDDAEAQEGKKLTGLDGVSVVE